MVEYSCADGRVDGMAHALFGEALVDCWMQEAGLCKEMLQTDVDSKELCVSQAAAAAGQRAAPKRGRSSDEDGGDYVPAGKRAKRASESPQVRHQVAGLRAFGKGLADLEHRDTHRMESSNRTSIQL